VTFAEAAVGFDTIAGGGVTAMLVTVMIAFLKRTKETDDRRDAGMLLLVEAASTREAQAWKERDAADRETEQVRALLDQERQEKAVITWERDQARREAEQLRIQLDVEREKNQ
jgi:uncharacterized damage-inducible protein DinB